LSPGAFTNAGREGAPPEDVGADGIPDRGAEAIGFACIGGLAGLAGLAGLVDTTSATRARSSASRAAMKALIVC